MSDGGSTVVATIILHCASCGGTLVTVDRASLPPAPPALAARLAPHDTTPHTHVRCPTCSPPWWCACVTLTMGSE